VFSSAVETPARTGESARVKEFIAIVNDEASEKAATTKVKVREGCIYNH
jgi:hypothetical protein